MSDIVERLAPCPFCGGEAELDNAAEPQFARRPTVTCKNENCFGYMPSAYYARDAEAIAAWNRRSDAAITALREEVERLRAEHAAARQNFHTMQLAADELRKSLTALRQRVVEVVGPFAEEAGYYDPPESDDADRAWDTSLSLGQLRAARSLINEMETTK